MPMIESSTIVQKHDKKNFPRTTAAFWEAEMQQHFYVSHSAIPRNVFLYASVIQSRPPRFSHTRLVSISIGIAHQSLKIHSRKLFPFSLHFFLFRFLIFIFLKGGKKLFYIDNHLWACLSGHQTLPSITEASSPPLHDSTIKMTY